MLAGGIAARQHPAPRIIEKIPDSGEKSGQNAPASSVKNKSSLAKRQVQLQETETAIQQIVDEAEERVKTETNQVIVSEE